MDELFSVYEKRALAMGDRDYTFSSSHDADVFVVFSKKGNDYTINIYTGDDALVAKKAAAKK